MQKPSNNGEKGTGERGAAPRLQLCPAVRGKLKLKPPPSQAANTSCELCSIEQPGRDRHPAALSSNSPVSNNPAGKAGRQLSTSSPGVSAHAAAEQLSSLAGPALPKVPLKFHQLRCFLLPAAGGS